MRRYLFFILAALVLVSCAREWEPEEVLPEEGLVERTWTVAMSDGTRATLDETLRPVWEVGEHLSVYDHVSKTGRDFVVQSVDGNIATISGSISSGGDTPFDAIYPAKSAGTWSSTGTNTLNLPDVQLIPSGRNVCPDVLVSSAHSDSPDGVITFHNISSLLKVQVGRDGIADITVDLVGTSEDDISSYKAAAAAGTLAKGTYFIAVDPGTYAGGLKVVCSDGFGQEYHKSSTTPLEAAVGGMKNLGTVSDGTPWRYYKVTNEAEYSSQQDLLDATGMLSNLGTVDYYKVIIWLAVNFSNRSTPTKAISYTYLSADPQGKPVELSGLIYIREAFLTEGTLTGIALANHGTIASNAQCPTRMAQYEGAFAYKDYAVVMSDYYGFGASSDRPQAYLDAETTARGNIDAYRAAVQLLTDLNVTIPSNLISFGYSQGGFNSMANLKYVTAHPELGIAFNKVLCGGGPFDVPLTWEAYREGAFRNAMGFVPMTVVSINESQKLGLSYNHLFKGSLLANWESWILSKQYTMAELNTLIDPSDTKDLSIAMADEMTAGTGPNFDAIMAKCVSYSLTSGWTPPSSAQTEIVLYHSTNDDTVPFNNFSEMKAFLGENTPGYTYISSEDGGHIAACISFIQKTISEW